MTAVASLIVTLTALLTVAAGTTGGGVWPLVPRPQVVRGFNPPETTWGSGHRGVDLLGRRGQTVRSAAAGRITFAGTLAGRGVVVVDHGTVRTTYQPVAADVQVGDHITRGQQIGTLLVGGSHCFPRACLHWGLLRGATYLDPLTLVGGGPVRLLPLTGTPPVRAGPVTAGLPFSPVPVTAGRLFSPGPVSAGRLFSPGPVSAGRLFSPGPMAGAGSGARASMRVGTPPGAGRQYVGALREPGRGRVPRWSPGQPLQHSTRRSAGPPT